MGVWLLAINKKIVRDTSPATTVLRKALGGWVNPNKLYRIRLSGR